MISEKRTGQMSLLTRREYNRVFRGGVLGGFEPIGATVRAIPKYIDAPERENNEQNAGIGGVMFGVAEVFFGLLVVLSMIGLVAVGLFLRGR